MRHPSVRSAIVPTVAVLVAALAVAVAPPASAATATSPVLAASKSTLSPAGSYGGSYTDSGPCIAGTYKVQPGVTQVQIVAIGEAGQHGHTVTTNLFGGPADLEGGVGGLPYKVNTVISVHAGQTLYAGVANSAMPGGVRSGDGSGGTGGAASWVSDADPTGNGGACAPARSSLLVVAAGGGGGGGAGAKGASNPGGAGGSEGAGGDGSTNKIEDGGGGGYPSLTAPGGGGAPGHSAGCHGGQYGRGRSDYSGGAAADAGVDVYGSLGDCSEPPPTCGPCQQYMQDSYGGGGGGGGGGYWGGGGGGGADDSGYGSGGGGASGRSYIATRANATSTSMASTRTTPIVQIIPVYTTPAVTSANNVTFAQGVYGEFRATATGANTPYVRFVGTLPNGMTASSDTDADGNGTGQAVLLGTPYEPGVFPLTVDACNNIDCVHQSFTLTVTGAPAFSSAPSTVFVAGQSNSFTVSTTGYPTPVLSHAGLPSGLSFHDNGNGTATISGSPSATGANSYADAITATNTIATTHQTVTIKVVTAISITPHVVYLVPGIDNATWAAYRRDFTQQLTATATFPDHSTGDITGDLAWSSSNVNAATVTGGSVVAVGLGTVTISAASASSTPATASVVVAMPLGITVTPTNFRMMGGTSQQFTATACYADPCSTNSVDISSHVVWSSPNLGMRVTVDGLGTAQPNGIYGTVFATVSPALAVPEVRGEADLTITHGNVVSVVLDPAGPRTLPTKGAQFYTPTLVYTDGARLPADKPLTWTTRDVTGTGVATALSSGNVIANVPGTATVQATYTNFDGTTVTGSSTLNVIRIPSSLTIQPATNPGNIGIGKGTTRQMQAIAHYGDGSPDVDVTNGVTWQSNDPASVSISSTGLAKGTGSHDNVTAILHAFYNYTDTNGNQLQIGATGSLTISIMPPVSIAVTPVSPSVLHPNDNVQFTAIGTYADGSTLDISRLVYWDSLPTTTTTVYPINSYGLLHVPAGVVHGDSTVYAYAFNGGTRIQSNSVVVTATDPLDHIQVRSLNPGGQYSITAGTSTPYPYQVTGYDSQNNSLGDVTADSTLSISPDGSCAADDTCTATVADTGTNAHTVTATDPNAAHPASPSLRLVVNRAAITHVSVTGGSTTITAGDSTAAFHVTGTDNYGNSADLTSQTYFRVTPVAGDSGCTSPVDAPTCHASVAGLHTIVATVTTTTPSTIATFPLWVNPYPTLDHLVLSGGSTGTLPGAATKPYRLTGFDKFGNSSDITDQSFLFISPDGTCDDVAHTCTPATVGVHQVTAQNYAPTPLTSNALALTTFGAPTISAAFSSSTASQGSLVNLSWTITNPNPSNRLTGIGFTASVPTSLVVNQFINGCGGSFDDPTGSFVLSGAALNGGASCTFTMVEHVMAAGALSSTTTPVTSVEGGAGNFASASLNVNGPAIVTAAFGSGSMNQGASLPLSFTITNPSATQTLTGIGFLTQLPSGLSFAGTAVTGTCGGAAIAIENGVLYVGPDGRDSAHAIDSGADGASLAPGQSCMFSVTVTGSALGHYTVSTSNPTSNEQGHGLVASAPVAVTVHLHTFGIQSPSELTAGTPGQFTVTAKDASGNTITDYAGSPTITGSFDSSDSGCGSDRSSPCTPAYTLSGFVNGVATATVTAYRGYYGGDITVTDGSAVGEPPFGTTVQPAALDHLTLTGGSSSINAGDFTNSYSMRGWDVYGNDLGDDPGATLSISPDGFCGYDSCSAQVADLPGSSHAVTATDPSAPHPTATSNVGVGTGPIVELDVSGGSTTIVAGHATAPYVVSGVDLYGNAIPVLPSTAVSLTMTPDGTCDQVARTCTATTARVHDVYFDTASPHVDLPVTVTAGALDHLVVGGLQPSVSAGASQGPTARGADRFGNLLGDVTASSTFTTDGGTCDAGSCTFTKAGDDTVTATDGAATGSAGIHVDARGLYSIQLGGGSASIVAGSATAAYTVSGFDPYGNPLGDVTSPATLSMTPDGTCSAGICSASAVGTHQVIAEIPASTAPTTTFLDVSAAPAADLTVRGGDTTVSTGQWTLPYYVTGHDEFGNYLGSVDVTLSISPDGHCDQTAQTCQAGSADVGDSFHTITFTAADGATATVPLTVTAGAPQYLVVSPNPVSVASGADQAFTAEGFDASGNDLGDLTSTTTFTIFGGGSCTANVCRSTDFGGHVVLATAPAGASGTAYITVGAGAVSSLKLTSALPVTTAGQPSAPYQVEGFDAGNNDAGDVTNSVTLSISPDGTCNQKAHTCQSDTADTGGSAHTVTATYDSTGATGTTQLVINEASVDINHLVLSPNPATVPAGTPQMYTATGYDSSNQPVGDVTASTAFTISGGSCLANVCTSTAAGTQIVYGYDGAAHGTATLNVTAGPVDNIFAYNASFFTNVGVASAPYTVLGYDAYGNDAGDVTASSTLSIAPDGTCDQTTHTCTSTVADTGGSFHTVTATDPGIAHPTVTTSLAVVSGGPGGPLPQISSVSPTSGPTAGGTVVTLTGTGFTGAVGVSFGSVVVKSITVVSDTKITVSSPAEAAGSVDVVVAGASGLSPDDPSKTFTFVAAAPKPSITAIAPPFGTTAGGTSVVISGTHLTGATSVLFGTTPAASFTVVSDSEVDAVSPKSAASVRNIRVVSAGGTSALVTADRYAYVGRPAITGVTPAAGPTAGGTAVVITGSGFSGTTQLLFGTVAATSFTVVSDSVIDAVSPKGRVSVRHIRVVGPRGTSPMVAADEFSYLPRPAVSSVSPSSGSAAGGTAVVIHGSGFTGATQVLFGTLAAPSFTVVSDTEVDAVSPKAIVAVRHVRVVTPGGTSPQVVADEFTYTAAHLAGVASLQP